MFQPILEHVYRFAASRKEILAVGICGSWARNEARPDSDIDLSIIVQDKEALRSIDWLEVIDFKKINEELDHFRDVNYGRVWSRHVFLKSGLEIEFSFADLSWADTEELDEGTIKVVKDGYLIIYDPALILENLVRKVKSISNP